MEDRLKEIASSVTNTGCVSQIICNDWNECSGGVQKRTCRDVAGCTTDTTEVRACQTTADSGQTPENVTYRLTGGAGNASNNGSNVPPAVGLFTGLNIGVNEMAGIVLILLIGLVAVYAGRGRKGKKSLQNLE